MSIWAQVGGEHVIRRLDKDLYRIVESQQQCATLNLNAVPLSATTTRPRYICIVIQPNETGVFTGRFYD